MTQTKHESLLLIFRFFGRTKGFGKFIELHFDILHLFLSVIRGKSFSDFALGAETIHIDMITI
jgi:hypothetical protein